MTHSGRGDLPTFPSFVWNILAVVVAIIGPPTLLFVLSHSGIASTCSSDWMLWGALLAAWLVGLAALACAHAPRGRVIIAAVVYSLLCIPLLPLAALSAGCSAGTCCQ
jgi:hypothetical protein